MQIEQFLATIKGMAANSQRAYEQSLWQLDSTMKGQEPTPEEIRAFLVTYPPASLHRHKAAISAYWEFRYPKKRWPFNRRQFTSAHRRIPRYVSPEVVQDIIDQATNRDDEMFVRTLFMLGCRIHELMDIDTANITPSGVRAITKGGQERLKPITKDFYKVLAAYAGKKRGKLFPRTYSYYRTTLKVLATKVGHPEVSPHMLRHARAVDLLRKGMPLPFVQQFLGHASINTTAIYTEITGGELVGELEKAENQ